MKRLCVVMTILALILSAQTWTVWAEEMPQELPELDLLEVLAPEEAPEYGEAPEAAQPQTAVAASDVADVAQAEPDGAQIDAIQALALNATALKLGVGESFALQPIVPAGSESLWFEYATSNKKIATVSEFGEVKGKKKGKATITVKASDGTVLTCSVKVLKAPKSISLNTKTVSLGYDALTGAITTSQLEAKLSKNSSSVIRFSSQNPAVVEVSPEGLLTPKGRGITTVTASTFNDRSASCTVAVLQGPERIDFELDSYLLCTGERQTLKLMATQGSLPAAHFISGDPAVAAVDGQTGEVTATGIGETTIVATSFNGMTASCRIAVVPGPDGVSLPASAVTMGVGEELMLGATPVRNDGQPTSPALKYTSSKAKCVAISDDGVLTAKKKGKAKITATAPNGVKATCTVKVVKAPTSINLSVGKDVLGFDAASGVAEQTKLSVSLSKGSGSVIRYTGYDPTVVAVAADGVVTAVGVGTTTITAGTYNGLTASLKVTVLAPTGQSASHKVTNVAHRGGAGYWPENTLEAFRNVASTGATAVELDVRTTKDGAQVVCHDASFTIGKKKYTVKKLTLSRLRRLRPDVCTLDEALDVLSASGLELLLELKNTATPKTCLEAVRERGMLERTLFVSTKSSLLSTVRRLEPSARLGLLFTETPSDLSALIASLRLECVCQRAAKLTLDNLQKWQQSGLRVGVWLVNDAASIRSWWKLGADYIGSDYPKLVTEVLSGQ